MPLAWFELRSYMEPKNIIVPLQDWLLGRGRCVGCGRFLGAEKRQRKNGIFLVTCRCRRIFVYNPEVKSYRRALFKEVDKGE